MGHSKVSERIGESEGETIGVIWGVKDEIHLHSSQDGRKSLSEGLGRFMLVLLGEFVASSQSTYFGLF